MAEAAASATSTAKKIPWFRMTAEGAAIVVSILLAFAIDAWWEGLREREEQREILQGLGEEFSTYENVLNGSLATNRRLEAHISRLLAWSNEDEPVVAAAAADSVLLSLIMTPTFDPGQGARDALITSGRLELIESRELRNSLAAWDNRVDQVREGELTGRGLVLNTIIPFLASKGIHVGRGYALSPFGDWWPSDVGPPPFSSDSWHELLQDAEF